LKAKVTGMVDFGVFVKLEEGLEGLVHISEIDWGLVDDPRHFFKVGDKVKVKIIDIKDGKVSLSVKALKMNPWQSAGDKYKKGDKVEGVVIKFNKHGALASIEEGIAGLVHISEFGSEEKLRQSLELGKRYPFTISLFDPKEMRMALSYVGTTRNKKRKPPRRDGFFNSKKLWKVSPVYSVSNVASFGQKKHPFSLFTKETGRKVQLT
jgi:small subunit ribosomal protein S1